VAAEWEIMPRGIWASAIEKVIIDVYKSKPVALRVTPLRPRARCTISQMKNICMLRQIDVGVPTPVATVAPTPVGTYAPTPVPTFVPTPQPTYVPSPAPTSGPTPVPTNVPSPGPTGQ